MRPEKPETPPEPVRTSYRLWRYAAGASVLAGAMTVPIVRDVAVARGTPVPDGADATLVVGSLIGVFVTVLVAVLVLVLAGRMLAGTSWARVVLTVVGVGIVVGGLLSLDGTVALFGVGLLGPVVGVLSLASLVLVGAAVTFMFRRDVGGWFDR